MDEVIEMYLAESRKCQELYAKCGKYKVILDHIALMVSDNDECDFKVTFIRDMLARELEER